jgi:plasmid maintenance system antidote protein VapI
MAERKAARKSAPAGHTLPDQLREIIASRGLAPTELGQLAGVDPTVIARFVAGERDLRLETAGRIAAALGLRLVEVARPRGRGRSAR